MHQIDMKAGYAGNTEVPGQKPLTNEIIGTTNEHLDIARHISQRLFELRDRLFGSAPTLAGSTGGSSQTVPASGFAEAYSGQSRELYVALNNIDSLSMELANRL